MSVRNIINEIIHLENKKIQLNKQIDNNFIELFNRINNIDKEFKRINDDVAIIVEDCLMMLLNNMDEHPLVENIDIISFYSNGFIEDNNNLSIESPAVKIIRVNKPMIVILEKSEHIVNPGTYLVLLTMNAGVDFQGQLAYVDVELDAKMYPIEIEHEYTLEEIANIMGISLDKLKHKIEVVRFEFYEMENFDICPIILY